jgi:hypothetical protein
MRKIFYILVFLPIFGIGQTTFDWDGTFDVVGSDTLLMNDVNYKLINYDYSLDSAFLSCNTAGSLILYNTDTVKLRSLFYPNYKDADTLWFQFNAADNENNIPYRITDIVKLATATPDLLEVPFEITPSMLIVPDEYATISSAISAAGISNDTIIVKSSSLYETNYTYWRYQNIISVAGTNLRSTGTSYVVLCSTEEDLIFQGFNIDAKDNTTYSMLLSSTVNNKTIKNCFFENAITYAFRMITTSTQDIDVNIDNCAFKSKQININNNLSINESYLFDNVSVINSTSIDTFRIQNSRCKFNLPDNKFINLSSDVDYVYIINNYFDDIKSNVTIEALNTSGNLFKAYDNVFRSDSIIVSNMRLEGYDKINCYNNYFYNNSSTTVANMTITRFDSCYIRNNYKQNITGNMYLLNASSTTEAEEIYVESNIDSTIAREGYFIRIGSEFTGASDNNINKIVIRDNIGFGQKYFYPDSTPTTHGVFVGFQSNDIVISRNNINGYGLNYVIKGSSGTNSTNTKILANISSNAYSYGFYSKGVDSIKFYNNTSYLDDYSYYFTENTGSDAATNCEVINSIIYTQGYAYQFDVNSSSNFTANNNVITASNLAYYNNINYNFSAWQGLGYDLNSFNTDPNLDANLVPQYKSDAFGNGVDLGTDYDTLLSPNGGTKVQYVNKSIGAYVPPFAKIDNYVADTLISIWSEKFNLPVFVYSNSDTIELGIDNFRTWTEKVNVLIDSVNVDTIIYGADNFETWRTKFNSAIDSVNNK